MIPFISIMFPLYFSVLFSVDTILSVHPFIPARDVLSEESEELSSPSVLMVSNGTSTTFSNSSSSVVSLNVSVAADIVSDPVSQVY